MVLLAVGAVAVIGLVSGMAAARGYWAVPNTPAGEPACPFCGTPTGDQR